MKKSFGIILLAAVITSCSKDDVVDVVKYEAISFGNVFVENSTKAETDPTHTTLSLDKFFVYGNVTGKGNTVNLYKGAEVYKENSLWKCNTLHYWVPECEYSFVAISDVAATDPANAGGDVVVKTSDGLPVSIDYNAAGQADLLYATAHITTGESGNPSTGTDENGHAKPVAFTFDHLLSKVQFTFTNDFAESSGVELQVTDIKITNAAKTALCEIGADFPKNIVWNVNSSFTGVGEDLLFFGNTGKIAAGGNKGTNSVNCVLIPNKQKFTITFTVKHNKGGSDTEKTITTDEITIQQGHFYNFTATLNADNVEGVVPITFTIITTDGWDNDPDKEVGPIYPEN